MSDQELLRISVVAEMAGVLASTIRHYTDMGLLKIGGYTDGGHRLYPQKETLLRISKIQSLSKRGLSLPEIKLELNQNLTTKKVLVVDDDREVGEFMLELFKLRFPEWQVQVVMDGFSAGRKLLEFFPDLVILDLMLPGIDGFQVCRQIRADSHLKDTVILAVTGFDSSEMKDKIMKCGASGYLAKPMDMNVLVDQIKKLMEQ